MGADYIGLKPKMLVEVGQTVGLGQALFLDKQDPAVSYTSPATGRVVAINRGRRRIFQSIVIELDDTAATESEFDPQQANTAAAIRKLLLRSGAWTGFRTRPYNRVAHSSSSPRSIFVTAIDTRPLAADPNVVIARFENEFEYGMNIIRQLADCSMYLCTTPNWPTSRTEHDGIQRVEFDGPHPAGLAGTHIHHLDPVAADRVVWHIGYQDVIAIGHLFKTGRLLKQRIVSIAGPGASRPRLVTTRPGANVTELTTDEVVPNRECRLVSGSILDGAAATDPVAFLGRYHNQVSVLPENTGRRLFGWFTLGTGRESATGLSARTRGVGRRREFTTARHGRQTAMLPVGAFERVIPMDILPVPLLRAIMVKDTDSAQALGCLELAEEDLALSSYVCPGKQNYGAALRINLDQIARDG